MRIELKKSHLELVRLKEQSLQLAQNELRATLGVIAEELGVTPEDSGNWRFDGKGFEKPDEAKE
jgi:hypothetical protein